jgi:hypothetical protein
MTSDELQKAIDELKDKRDLCNLLEIYRSIKSNNHPSDKFRLHVLSEFVKKAALEIGGDKNA